MANYYSKDLRWADLTQSMSVASQNLRDAITRAYEEHLEFEVFRAHHGTTAGNIQTHLSSAGDTGVTNGDVTNMIEASDSMKEIYDFTNNVASPVQGDRFEKLRQFNR